MPRNRNGVRVTLYMPDELRQRAQARGLNLSRILRDAVERELRGDERAPTVEVERTGESVELRITVPAALID